MKQQVTQGSPESPAFAVQFCRTLLDRCRNLFCTRPEPLENAKIILTPLIYKWSIPSSRKRIGRFAHLVYSANF